MEYCYQVSGLEIPAVRFFEEHGVGLTGALPFGGPANCCRLNFGCSRETLELAINRMLAALETLHDACQADES